MKDSGGEDYEKLNGKNLFEIGVCLHLQILFICSCIHATYKKKWERSSCNVRILQI